MSARAWVGMVAASMVLAAGPVVRGEGNDDLAARVIPADDLIIFAEWTGLDAHPEGWKRTAAARLLSETKLGTALTKLMRQGLTLALAESPGGDKPPADQIEAMINGVLRHGALFAVSGRPKVDPQPRVTLVVRRPGDALRRLIEKSLADGRQSQVVEHAGRRMTRTPGGSQPSYYWMEGNDLVVHLTASGEDLAFVERLQGGKLGPAHERRQALLAEEGAFQPILAAWFDLETFAAEFPPEFGRMGLDGLTRVDLRWGYEGDALRTIARVKTTGPRGGVLSLMDQPSFNVRAGLKVVPKDATDFIVMSLDAATLYDRVLGIAKIQANDPAQVAQGAARLDERLGVALRDEVLAHLGPMMAVRIGEGQVIPMPAGPAAPLIPMVLPRVTVVGELREPAKLREAMKRMIPKLQAELAQGAGEGIPKFQEVDGGYTMALSGLPPGFDLSPTMLIGERVMVMATTTEDARAVLAELDAGRGGWTADGAFAQAIATLPDRAIMLGVGDPRQTMPEAIASLPQVLEMLGGAFGAARDQISRNAGRDPGPPLPSLVPSDVPTADEVRPYLFPSAWTISVDDDGLRYDARESVPGLSVPAVGGVAVALLLPAVQAAREAARRAQCVNNEKQIILAMVNYEATYGRYPAAASVGKDGQPLLSWRVAILPYIEQNSLYQKFHLDEPWDSPHNLPLLKEMPPTYACPSKPPQPGMTSYRVVTGAGVPFGVMGGVALRQITDGTSNTIAIVEATEDVEWTRPEEFPIEENVRAVWMKLGSNHPGGINAAFLDGSVKFLKKSTDPSLVLKLLTHAGGEVIRMEEVAPPAPPRRPDPPPAPPAGAGLLPAVQEAREAARRAQCSNNLKQMALALHNYHDRYNAFPPAAITGKDGKPLLSWRVAILPYIERNELYAKFHLDEPWDSPHNLALLKEMPVVYACPSAKIEEGMTHYRAPTGEGLAFEMTRPVSIRAFRDGTSNTLLIVESDQAVPWTKPDAEAFDMGSEHPGGFQAAFVDGSVKFLPDGLDPLILKALSTRAGSDVIRPEMLVPKDPR